jgi:hypothetical protein
MYKKSFLILILSFFVSFSFSQNNSNIFYSKIINLEHAVYGKEIVAKKSALYSIDEVSLRAAFAKITYNNKTIKGKNEVLIKLPNFDGSSYVFRVYRNTTMSEGLSLKFPNIRTYDAVCTTNSSIRAKIDITEKGFHAMIMQAGESTVFIDPYIHRNNDCYILYSKKDFLSNKIANCSFGGKVVRNNPSNQNRSFGTCELRTYRLALSASAEYTTYHGGTVAGALSSQVTTMNRVNGIFERDMAITMSIVANNNLIIYTNSSTDPFTNGSPGNMINENQTSTDNVIGNSNYDIGHVFGTNSGGLAGLGVVCSNSSKARGVTGSSNPIGDPFDVDYVAHEMGHQFGANHTFNNSCSGNRNNSTAMEPGSGNTIMAYAGICSPNTQNNSDDHFHGISLEEIENEILSNPHNCPVISPIVNSAPVISSTNGNVTIPASTPFVLTAIASDVDGDTLTYNWEQMNNDISTQSPVSTATGGPNFISKPSLLSPTRYFPNLADLSAGVSPTWEVLPSVSRIMDFRVIVRDNSFGSGCNDHADITMTIDASSGPFEITYPNTSGIIWNFNTSETITWNVANTDQSPVSCTNVDIFLSVDGGLTYPNTLATNVPNDGSETILVPNFTTTTARVMVISSNGTFFDISDNDFEIIGGVGCNNPDIPVVSGLDTTCINDTVTLSISSGNLNDANSWQWYEDSCGGIALGSGLSINVVANNPLNSYFVRGEGGCVIAGACASHNVVTQNTFSINDSACLIYSWNGNTYSSSGTYIDTLTSISACDSIVTLNLIIYTQVYDSSSVSTCGSYVWYGNTYTNSGIYTDTIYSQIACDSIVTLNLTINTQVYDSISVSTCGSYSWNGNSYNVSGVYTDTIYSQTACDSISTLYLTITQGFTDSISAISCGSYFWNSNTYTSSGIYYDSLLSSTGCDSIIALYLTIEQDYNVSISASACSSYTWNGSTYSSSGTYLDTLTSISGCDSLITLNLSIINSSESPLLFTLVLDDYCRETSWELINSSNTILYSGGQYSCNPNGGGAQANDTIFQQMILDTLECYRLTIYDDFGDGLNAAYWGGIDGSWLLEDNLNSTLFSGSGNFGDSVYVEFMLTSIDDVGIFEQNNASVLVYPNPFSNSATISVSNMSFPYNLELTDLRGKKIKTWQNINSNKFTINNDKISSGVYFLIVKNKNGILPIRVYIN